MPGVNIRKDDTVKVMTGKSAGHTGRVIRVLPREGRVMVETSPQTPLELGLLLARERTYGDTLVRVYAREQA